MAQHLIVAQFDDYGTAHRAFAELLQAGTRPNEVSIIAGDRSNSFGADRDFGLLEAAADTYIAAVRRGRTLLAVLADASEHELIAEIIAERAPAEIEERRHTPVLGTLPRR